MGKSSFARALSNSAPTISKAVIDDALMLQNSDNPTMLLVSVQLNGINYRGWSRAMRIALGAKNKLAFVEGKIDAPEDRSEEYEKWRRCDYMVTSWILNSISKDLIGSFLYATTAREFKLKQLWDELANIVSLPLCICGSEKLATEIHNADHLMQFLMGLNDTFDQVHPLPTVNKAFSIVLRVESQKKVQSNLTEHGKVAALAIRSQGSRRDYKKYDIRKGHCDYCNLDGHTRAGCFKLIGYLEWFKSKNKQFNNPGTFKPRYTAHISHTQGHSVESTSETPLASAGPIASNELSKIEEVNTKLELLRQEMTILVKGKTVASINTVSSHPAYCHNPTNYTGNRFSSFSPTDCSGSSSFNSFTHKISSVFACCAMVTGSEAWIIDTGASDHITPYKNHMKSMCSVTAPITIYLPNSSSTQVTHIGNVALNTHMKLIDVLLVPDFNMNLL
ncbi:uncharacterized protein LOC122721800 [Manihot esculenta]|uniref:uncharacterized protein LOC122721800 n=1 Tax=Manihot esculenta TaxID=3983 RepID=UPI001CC4731D|nr:uncharacterized protein LOC122721800 [Manihot esculenta]